MAAGGSPGSSHSGLSVSPGLCKPLVRRIVDLYVAGGLSTYRVAREVGMNRQRVTRVLHREGVVISPQGKGRSRPSPAPATLEELRRLYIDKRLTTPAIGRLLGVSDRSVRTSLARYGIERRHRGAWDRRDRVDVDPTDICNLYVRKELPAEAVGDQLGVSRRIVLRAAHNHGLPVRPGGAPSATSVVQLIEALYNDPGVRRALRRHRIAIVARPGMLHERFPCPARLSPPLLRELYVDCGLSSFQIELVTGQPSSAVLRGLESVGIERRPKGGLSPFMARWRKERSKSQSSQSRSRDHRISTARRVRGCVTP